MDLLAWTTVVHTLAFVLIPVLWGIFAYRRVGVEVSGVVAARGVVPFRSATSVRGFQPMKLEMNNFEAVVLKRSMDVCLSEMRMEAARTDNREYREELYRDLECLEDIQARLEEQILNSPSEEKTAA